MRSRPQRAIHHEARPGVMPPNILSSPLLNVAFLNKLLSSPTLPHDQRVQLLSAKLHLISNNQGGSSKETDGSRVLEELELRLELARAHLDNKLPGLVPAEAELTIVERRCKAISKRAKRMESISDQTAPGNGDIGGAEADDARTGITAKESGTVEDEPVTSEVLGARDMPPAKDVLSLRIRALEMLREVEEGLGREGRAKRWKDLIKQLQEELPERRTA